MMSSMKRFTSSLLQRRDDLFFITRDKIFSLSSSRWRDELFLSLTIKCFVSDVVIVDNIVTMPPRYFYSLQEKKDPQSFSLRATLQRRVAVQEKRSQKKRSNRRSRSDAVHRTNTETRMTIPVLVYGNHRPQWLNRKKYRQPTDSIR